MSARPSARSQTGPTELALQWAGHSGGATFAVAAHDRYLYYSEGPRLAIAHASGSAPQVTLWRSEPLADVIHDIVIEGAHAYVAAGRAGVAIFDLAQPAAPRAVGHLDTRGSARRLRVSEAKVVYVADGRGGLGLITAADPSSPQLLSNLVPGGEVVDVAVDGAYAYIVEVRAATEVPVPTVLSVVDVSQPQALRVVGTRTADVWYRDLTGAVEVAGGRAYWAVGNGVAVLDVTRPEEPTVVAEVELVTPQDRIAAPGRYVAVTAERVYVATGGTSPAIGGVWELDTSRLPEMSGRKLLSAESVAGLSVAGPAVFYAITHYGVGVVDLSVPTTPRVAALIATEGIPLGVAAIGKTVFTAAGIRGLQIFDAQDPHGLRSIGGDGQSLIDVAVPITSTQGTGGFVYTSQMEGDVIASQLVVMDVTDATTPHGRGRAGGFGRYRRLAVGSDHVYAAVDLGIVSTNGLQVLNVADPDRPFKASFLAIPNGAIDVAADGHYVYVAASDGDVRIVDVSAPQAPRQVSVIERDGNAVALAVSDGRLCVAVDHGAEGSQLLSFDISNPGTPQAESEIALEGRATAVTCGDYAYVGTAPGDRPSGVYAVELSQPASPRIIDWIAVAGHVDDLAGQGLQVFVAARQGGLYAMRLARDNAVTPTATATPSSTPPESTPTISPTATSTPATETPLPTAVVFLPSCVASP